MEQEMIVTLKRFAGLFRIKTRLPWTILVPLLAVLVSWPILQMWLHDQRATFMVVFVLALGLRLVLRSGGAIRMMRSQISNRGTVIVTLLFGPGAVAGLIWMASRSGASGS